jgi:hypothetical protein
MPIRFQVDDSTTTPGNRRKRRRSGALARAGSYREAARQLVPGTRPPAKSETPLRLRKG